MQYVTSIPRYRADIGVTDIPEPTSAVQPVKRVVPRTLPPLIYQHRPTARQAEPSDEIISENPIERRKQAEERRQVCRRVRQLPATLDTRSGHDRRHGAWRKEDHLASSVDTHA
jgi:hypothetical protein